MVKKYDALDWQSFAQKKDIEEIAKNTRDKNEIQLTATIEIAMAVSAIVAENIEKCVDKNIPSIVWIMLGLGAVLPMTWLIGKVVYRLWKKHKRGSDIPDLKSMINLFDNDICYYALMSESYCEKLKEIDKNKISNLDKFYFIETCFYVNKTIYNLSCTTTSIGELYSDNVYYLYKKRVVSITRLKNIFNIIDNVIQQIDTKKSIIEDIDVDNNYWKLFEEYKTTYTTFKAHFENHSK